MARTVFCQKLQREAEGLDVPPLPGPLGKKVFDNISREAWQQWQRHQTMLVNENRLSMVDPEARKYLMTQLEQFLFGEGADQVLGYVPPKN